MADVPIYKPQGQATGTAPAVTRQSGAAIVPSGTDFTKDLGAPTRDMWEEQVRIGEKMLYDESKGNIKRRVRQAVERATMLKGKDAAGAMQLVDEETTTALKEETKGLAGHINDALVAEMQAELAPYRAKAADHALVETEKHRSDLIQLGLDQNEQEAVDSAADKEMFDSVLRRGSPLVDDAAKMAGWDDKQKMAADQTRMGKTAARGVASLLAQTTPDFARAREVMDEYGPYMSPELRLQTEQSIIKMERENRMSSASLQIAQGAKDAQDATEQVLSKTKWADGSPITEKDRLDLLQKTNATHTLLEGARKKRESDMSVDMQVLTNQGMSYPQALKAMERKYGTLDDNQKALMFTFSNEWDTSATVRNARNQVLGAAVAGDIRARKLAEYGATIPNVEELIDQSLKGRDGYLKAVETLRSTPGYKAGMLETFNEERSARIVAMQQKAKKQPTKFDEEKNTYNTAKGIVGQILGTNSTQLTTLPQTKVGSMKRGGVAALQHQLTQRTLTNMEALKAAGVDLKDPRVLAQIKESSAKDYKNLMRKIPMKVDGKNVEVELFRLQPNELDGQRAGIGVLGVTEEEFKAKSKQLKDEVNAALGVDLEPDALLEFTERRLFLERYNATDAIIRLDADISKKAKEQKAEEDARQERLKAFEGYPANLQQIRGNKVID